MTAAADPGSAANTGRRVPPRVLAAVCSSGAVVLCGALGVIDPVLALGVMAAAVVALAALRWPDVAIFAVIFLIYSNLAVVGTRFHGVPKIAVSALPLLLLLPLVRDLVLRRQGIIAAPALPFLLLLLAVRGAGALFSRDTAVSARVVFEFVTEGILLYVLVTNTVRTPRALRAAVWALLVAGFVTALVPIYQQLTGTQQEIYGGLGQTSEVGFRTGEVSSRGEVRQVRLAGPIGDQNRFAQNMLVLLPLGLFHFLGQRRRRERRWARLLALVLTGFAGTAFLLTFSRGGAVAFALVLALMVVMRIVSARVLLAVVVVAGLGLAAMPRYRARLASLEDVRALFSGGSGTLQADSSMRRRLTEMLAAAMVFADHPVIGVGPGMFKYYSQEYGNRVGIRKLEERRKAHSLFLEVAAESGTLGLAAFLGFVLVTLHGLVRARRRLLQAAADAIDDGVTGGAPSGGAAGCDPGERLALACTATGFLLAILAYLAAGLFLHLAYVRFFYLVMALGASAAWVGRRHGVAPPSGGPRPALEAVIG